MYRPTPYQRYRYTTNPQRPTARRVRIRNPVIPPRQIYTRNTLTSFLRRGGPSIGRNYYNRRSAYIRYILRNQTHLNGRNVPHIWQRIRRYI